MRIWKTYKPPTPCAGASSAMQTGPDTDDPPIPRPPINRKIINDGQLHATAQPMAETMYIIAIMRNAFLPPICCPITPAIRHPTTVPHKAIETVNPSMVELR